MAANSPDPAQETIHLTGYIDDSILQQLTARIRASLSSQTRQRFVVHCAGTSGFSGQALAALAALIHEVRSRGAEMALIHLPQPILDSVVPRLLEAYLAPALAQPLQRLVELAHIARPCPTAAHSASPN